MRFAMVLKSRVIGILDNLTEPPCWGPDNKGNNVTAIACEDLNVAIGWRYNFQTGTFYKHQKPEIEKTAAEKVLDIVSKSKEEIENAAVDAFTEELIEGGML